MKPRIPIPISRRRRPALLVATLLSALLLVAAVAIPAALVFAQDPPTDELAFVNASEDPVERKGDGRFIARPVFSHPVGPLYYGVRDPDTGEWLTTMFSVRGGEKERQDGWEYSFEYPFEDGQVELDKERPYLLVILAIKQGETYRFYAAIPEHRPGGIWNKILRALDPKQWGRAIAGWVIEGTHGTLCGVVERATGEDADRCEGP
ncbi:MAG: hypothetical protein OXH12_03225 [Chloroflexi bacterium]|nr:hypothetical protein [Chloroflexota bacterium]